MPLPTETLLRVQDSPVPTQTTFGFLGSSAMAPMDITGCLSNTGRKVVAPSVDFHTPPEAEPTNSVTLPSSSTRPESAAMRPLITAAPMFRAPSPESTELSNPGAGLACAQADTESRTRSGRASLDTAELQYIIAPLSRNASCFASTWVTA